MDHFLRNGSFSYTRISGVNVDISDVSVSFLLFFSFSVFPKSVYFQNLFLQLLIYNAKLAAISIPYLVAT